MVYLESYQFLKELVSYDDEKAKEILEKFETPIQYKKIYAIAGIAGHASPTTTFSSYIHLTDIQLGLRLWHTDFKLTAKHSDILNIPRRHKSKIETAP
ncbi:hypothetical protein [Psychrobacter sp. I-STPA6b]|uniref:hypothetical protein n=1 Tax=Psychrobacter sp. I-STPA6b TaxID=2585718 RepID=UPI001D0C8371|nr:hypothetical protein [Psychrobacter sp. I-STPA6b]